MAIVYVTTGAWGTGTGAPISAAQVDGNFYNLDQRVITLNADLAEGKRIDTVTYTDTSMTFHFTDGTTQTIPLPIAVISYAGQWTNSTPYARGKMVSVPGSGMYQVLVDHTTPALPAVFDPNATDGSGHPLYSLWMPLYDISYDAQIFMPGSMQRTAGELLFEGTFNRAIRLDSGNANAYAHLDVAIPSGGSNIVISIQKNITEIGTITFTIAGGQTGSINIPATTQFAAGDRYSLRVTSSANAAPSGMSITLPFIRMDI